MTSSSSDAAVFVPPWVADAVDMCKPAEAGYMCKTGMNIDPRLQVAMEVALKQMGYDTKDVPTGYFLIPESDAIEATALAVSMVRSVERLALDHGVSESDTEMYNDKDQVLVALYKEDWACKYRQCNVCLVCHSNMKKWCAGCKERIYCSRECQKKDWKSHKANCGISLQDKKKVFVPRSPCTMKGSPCSEDRTEFLKNMEQFRH